MLAQLADVGRGLACLGQGLRYKIEPGIVFGESVIGFQGVARRAVACFQRGRAEHVVVFSSFVVVTAGLTRNDQVRGWRTAMRKTVGVALFETGHGEVARAAGTQAPRIRVPYAIAYSAAVGAELAARVRGHEPFITRDGVRMARKRMYFTSAKAARKLGYEPRPAREAIADAVGWFKANGYLR